MLLGGVWAIVGCIFVALISYVPAGLGFVDDYRWGKVVGGFMLPSFCALFLAGVLFVGGKRIAGLVISGVILAAYCALDGAVIVLATR